MNTPVPLESHPVDSGISPWGGYPLYFDQFWAYHRDKENWLKCVVDNQGVVILTCSGWCLADDFSRVADIFDDIIGKIGWQDKTWVLLFDCSFLRGMEISARGKLIEILLSRKSLKGVVFSSPSYLVNSLVQLAVKFYNPHFSVAVSESWDMSCRKICEWLPLPSPDSSAGGTSRFRASATINNSHMDAVLRILGEVEWNKPGTGFLESAVLLASWKPFLTMVTTIKSDIDSMIEKREARLRELQHSNEVELALQKKLSAALETSQKARVAFEQESERNLTLSRVMIDTQKETLFALGEIIESRSKETANHIRRVAEYSMLLARFSGMDEREQQQILHASPMHDAGKIAIPDRILNKPGKLTDDEFATMKDHARLGWEMLRSSPLEIMQHAAVIAYQHHEKWNGNGYPGGLHGENIHLLSRMVAIADVFDALGSDRCYKKAWPLEKALELMRSESGEHFDPGLIDIFFQNLGAFLAIRERFPDVAA
ncbi:MAG: HD domain-containing protein [Chitinispirillaceae bacterium]|nr:HD domain-containing protein [Chitinispirillaceae bacterium]